jgi:hypothetical protein
MELMDKRTKAAGGELGTTMARKTPRGGAGDVALHAVSRGAQGCLEGEWESAWNTKFHKHVQQESWG